MRGFDWAKKVKGRKRQLLVDTEGFVLWAVVQPANATERQGAVALLREGLRRFTTVELVWADAGYEGEALEEWLENSLGVRLEIVHRLQGGEPTEGFVVAPRRWVVERTFSWIVRNRRMRCDYEFVPESSEAFIHVAMSRLMLKRLARSEAKEAA